MLFKLSIRNIQRSLKDYAIYFVTLVLGVAVFYIFNSIESQTAMVNLSETTHELLDMMYSIMLALSVLVAVVLGFLIIYASRFLMKRRKKEFGIYMTLGMSKWQISKILLLENLAIGLLSLAVGLILGILLSQLMSVLVANMFEADLSAYQFVFSNSAFVSTVLSFGLIYLIVMIFNTFLISRQKLIKLIHSDQMNEKIKMHGLVLSSIVMIAAIAVLSYTYAGITVNVADLNEGRLLLLIGLGCLGTFMFFWGLSGLALRILPKFKKFYYKGLNTFVFREINSKINTTVISMSVISVLLFLTIVIFSSAMSISNTFNRDLEKMVPADFQATKLTTKYLPENDLSTQQIITNLGVDADKIFRDTIEVTIYRDDELTYEKTIGAAALQDLVLGENVERLLSNQETIMHVGDYNKLARLYSNEELTLSDNQYAVVADYENAVKARNKSLRDASLDINLAGPSLSPKYDEVKIGTIEMSSNKVNSGIIIVPDSIDLSGQEAYNFFIANYNVDDEEAYAALEAEVSDKLVNYTVLSEHYLSASTKQEIYDQSVGISAVVTFIGLYLGIVFLITSAALLSLKELSDSSDNQEKYAMLGKLGVDQKTLNRSLLAQIGIFFGLPLALAIVHSIFGIMFANNIILSYMSSDLLMPITATAFFIIAIYGGYFVVTYYLSRRITIGRE